MVVRNSTLHVINPIFPLLSLSSLLTNIEHSSSGVRKYDHASSEKMLYLNSGLSRQGRESFSVRLDRRTEKRWIFWLLGKLPPQRSRCDETSS